MSDSITLYNACPFLSCLKPFPHSHYICGKCGAVRYGNLFCSLCKAMREVLGDER